jgi:16S rRNA processing protein RimM
MITKISKIHLASCNSVHGIKGEFNLFLFNPESRLIEKDQEILIIKSKKEIHFTVESIRYGNKTILKFKEISDRNTAENLLPFDVYINRDELEVLDDEEYYLADLIGLNAIDDSTKKIAGKIVDYYENKMQGVLVIKLISNENVEVVFHDNFIKEINLENGEVCIIFPKYID